MIVKRLQDLGFTEKEAKIYVGLLGLGKATAQELACQTGINRATAYVTLENLLKRKFINKVEKAKKTVFSIENPLQILEFLKKEKDNVEIRINLAKNLMPELEMLEKVTGEKANVKFYEGREGLGMIQKDFVRSKPKEWLEIFNLNAALKSFPVSENDHRQIVRKKKMAGRAIAVYDPKIKIPYLPPLPNSERRYLPLNKMPFNAEISLYNDKAVLISYSGKLMAVVVQNKAITDGLRYLFELAWEGAEKFLSLSEQKKKL